MSLKWFVLLCSIVSCFGERNKAGKIGDRCLFSRGNAVFEETCHPASNCSYPKELIHFDKEKPPMCWWEGEMRIVCCPLNNTMFRTGVYGRLYDPISDGVKRSGTTICRYDGAGDRHQCCPVVPDRPLPEEPECPPLVKPKPPPALTAVQLIAWNKCVENLRFVKQCIALPGDRHRHIRHYECGIQYQAIRISGGRPAEPKEFPHMVVLGVAEDSHGNSDVDAEWVGGGALVSDKFVLTAAHVLVDPSGRPLRYALLGTLNKKDVLNGLLHIIVRKIPHDMYQPPNKQHDIALVELDRRVTLSSFVRPICLPVPRQATDRTVRQATDRTDRQATDRTVRQATNRTLRQATDRTLRQATDRTVRQATDRTVRQATDRTVRQATDRTLRQAELHIAGWGRIGDSENAAQLLQTAQVSVQSYYSECQIKFGSYYFQFNSSTMLCVKDSIRDRAGNTSKDICPGKSGGPLMAVLSDVQCSYSAEGVASFGPSCGHGAPGVYTRVEHYLDWIVRNVWPDEWQRATAADIYSD